MKNCNITLLILSYVFMMPIVQAQQMKTTVKIDQDSTIIPQRFGPQTSNVANSIDVQVDASANQNARIQTDPMIVINPLNPKNIIVSVMSQDPTILYSAPTGGAYTTIDGGVTWSGSDNITGAEYISDETVAFGNNNNAYYCYLVNTLPTSSASNNWKVRIRKSPDGGISWLPAVDVSDVGDRDRPFVTAYGNNVYVAWTDFLQLSDASSCSLENNFYPVNLT